VYVFTKDKTRHPILKRWIKNLPPFQLLWGVQEKFENDTMESFSRHMHLVTKYYLHTLLLILNLHSDSISLPRISIMNFRNSQEGLGKNRIHKRKHLRIQWKAGLTMVIQDKYPKGCLYFLKTWRYLWHYKGTVWRIEKGKRSSSVPSDFL
jgi:hypothetical protein